MRAVRSWLLAAIGLVALLTLSCGLSIPNLEDEQCSGARDAVREFYSWYLGTDSEMRARQQDIYSRFVSPDFSAASGEGIDPFLISDTPPTTFKVGKCEQKDDAHVNMQVQLYWRHDSKTDQKEVYADMIKTGNRWLIERVESR